MAKRNEITVGQKSQLSVRQAVRETIAVRVQNGLGCRFSNRQAIETVCKAIQINCSTNATEEQKQAATLFATEIAINSDTAGEEIKETIRAMQADIVDDNPPF